MPVMSPPASVLWLPAPDGAVIRRKKGGASVAQLVKCPTLDFGSGPDLGVMRSSPAWGSALIGESAGDSLSLHLLPLLVRALSKINK